MRPNFRHLFWLIALAVLAALVVLLLVRPQVVAPTAESESSPVEPIRDPIPVVDPMPWAGVDWQPQEEPFAADQPPVIRMDGIVDGGDLILGWGRASTPGRNQFNDMGAVFVSRDGRSWQTALIDHGVEAANGSELNGVFSSPDGRRWTPVGPRQPIGNGVAIGLAVRDRQVLAVADHFDGNRSEIRIWLGSAN